MFVIYDLSTLEAGGGRTRIGVRGSEPKLFK
jgi:hypothetical protein